MIFLSESRMRGSVNPVASVSVLNNCFRMDQLRFDAADRGDECCGAGEIEEAATRTPTLRRCANPASDGSAVARPCTRQETGLLELAIERRATYAELTRRRGYVAVVVAYRFLDRVQFYFLETVDRDRVGGRRRRALLHLREKILRKMATLDHLALIRHLPPHPRQGR